ncbi:MAG: phenylacetate--CoA ligase family protein [Rhodospirillales bacterium]|nr:phenylacetate--CoA ligase family protein [Rhodospirillales bacterium]
MLFAALAEQIANAKANAPAFTESLAKVVPQDVASRAELARLPIVRKSELMDRQKRGAESGKDWAERAPFGGLTAVKTGQLARIFASPGPIYDPEAMRPDYWRIARALYAAGFRRSDVIQNCFAYHLTPAGSMLESGAHALGCAVIPAGVGNSEQQVRVAAEVGPRGYIGTPSFLKIILDKAKEMGTALPTLKLALVSGEALPNALRDEFAAAGIQTRQCYATADLGLIGYESVPGEGLILDEWIIVEIVRPGTGDPLPDGEIGEVVVTTLNPDYPLIRFATGDLSTFLPGTSSCGRTNRRLKGWMGRADQTTKVRGMFVHPSQVAEILRRHPEIAKGRLVVGRDQAGDTMTLKCEIAGGGNPGLAAAIVESIQTIAKLRGTVEFVAPGSLPNDGKVIEDVRKYD